MKYERQIKKVSDSDDLQEQIRGHWDYRLAAAIPWGDNTFLVFERDKDDSLLSQRFEFNTRVFNDSPF